MITQKRTTVNSKVCFGIQNVCKNDFYIPFFDYDITDYNAIRGELRYIQNRFFLSDIYIFNSKNGYNAICLDKLPFDVLTDMYNECGLCCYDFKYLGIKRGYIVLRIGEDKILKEILKGNSTYQKSLCHALALDTFYSVKIDMDNQDFDDNTELIIYAYRSAKHGFLEVKDL